MKHKTKLKPCPFCGASGVIKEHPKEEMKFFVGCSSNGRYCTLFPNSGAISAFDLDVYVAAWNGHQLKYPNIYITD